MNPSEDRLAELEVENAALRAQVSELPILRAQITALPSRWLALPPPFFCFVLRVRPTQDEAAPFPDPAEAMQRAANRPLTGSPPPRGQLGVQHRHQWRAPAGAGHRCRPRPRPLSSLIGIWKAGLAL